MSNITIQNFDDDLKNRLQKRAEYYGRSIEEEAKEILRAVLTEKALKPLNLALAIEQRFANFGDVEIPTIPIDQLVISPEIKVINIRTGSKVGSDHFPIITDLAIPRS